MTRHALRRRDVELIGRLTKHFLDSLCLRDIAHMRGSAMHIDVIDILRLQSCILQGILHHEFSTQTFRMRSRDVISVSTHTGSHHLCIDLCTASLGVLQFFENQTTGTLGHDETVAACAEGAACLFGFVIASGERLHGIESTYTYGAYSSLGTASHDSVGLTQTNQVEGISQGIAGRSTGRSRDVVRTVEAVHDGNLSGSDVGNHLRDEERIELWPVFLVSPVVFHFVLKRLDTADTHTIDNTDTVFVFGFQIHSAVFYGLFGSNDGQLCIAVHLSCFLAVNILIDIEPLHFTGELCLEFRGIEKGNRSSTTLTGQQVFPSLLSVETYRRNGT